MSAWFGSTLCLVSDHGKSTLCLVFYNLSWAQGKSTPCLVLMVGSVTWTTSKMSSMVLRLLETIQSFEISRLSETVHNFRIKLLSETVQGRRLSWIGDCPRLRDCPWSKTIHYRRLFTVGDCPQSETVHCRRMSMVGDCIRALNEVVIRGCPKDLIYKNKKHFVLDKGSLGETPMTSFHIWHMHV